MRVDGKVALVTGGAGGIGAAAARFLAAEGAAVLIGDILAEQGQATADTIAASGGRAGFVALDVTNPQDWSNGRRPGCRPVRQAGRSGEQRRGQSPRRVWKRRTGTLGTG